MPAKSILTHSGARVRRAAFLSKSISGLAAAVCACLSGQALAARSAASSCHVGAYELTDHRIIDVSPSDDGDLRWRDLDGATGSLKAVKSGWQSFQGWTDRPDRTVTFGPCGQGRVKFGRISGRRIPLRSIDTTFSSHDTNLAGRLVMPPGGKAVPIVILLHGSEHDSAKNFNFLQRLFPAQGIGVFVYDKRGTGASGGAYTQDFSLLSDDAVAALREARRLAGRRGARFGFQGPSQGGWIAPLAATKSRTDFVIVSFGLAVSVIDEDREAITFAMRLKGHGDEEIRKALEIGSAAEALFESGFTTGFEEFDRVRAKYRSEPWYKDVRGDFTYLFLDMSSEELRRKGAQFRFGTPFRYDPMPTLRQLNVPQLWVLGGQDLDAPSEETSLRLKRLIAAGKPITLALYPMAEHGLTQFEVAPDGTRISTRYVPGYFRMMADFVKTGRIGPRYRDALITRNDRPKEVER
jgi:hypothetical protein